MNSKRSSHDRGCRRAAVAGLLLAAPLLNSVTVEPGHTALWYDPARSGEGFVLEILHDERALLYWYTYDEQGSRRWVQGIGGVTSDENGQILAFPEFYITRERCRVRPDQSYACSGKLQG